LGIAGLFTFGNYHWGCLIICGTTTEATGFSTVLRRPSVVCAVGAAKSGANIATVASFVG